VVNPVTKQVLLINTPRDYYVINPASKTTAKNRYDKLTHCGINGVSNSMKALATLYDTDVAYYARVNFSGLRKLVNAVGGITVYSDRAFTAVNTKIVKGENHLWGQGALDFCRERYNLPGGDNDRGKNQMKVINAIIDKLTSGAIITNYSAILDSMKGMFATNVTMDEISWLVKMQLNDMAEWDVFSIAVAGKSARRECYSMPGYSLYVMLPNEKQVNKVQTLIDRMMAGEVLTKSDVS
jgi:LCP family protein required for cell wall assembly